MMANPDLIGAKKPKPHKSHHSVIKFGNKGRSQVFYARPTDQLLPDQPVKGDQKPKSGQTKRRKSRKSR